MDNQKLSKEEMLNVTGGISWGLWGIGGVIFTFILGFFEGVMNPIKCGKQVFKVSKQELLSIYGGISFSGTLINAITKMLTQVYDIGRRFGTGLLRGKTKNFCSF